MIEISIPGYKRLQLKYLVLDHNGTLAVDGILVEGVKARLVRLSTDMEIHVLTADTFGKAKSQLTDIPCKLSILPVDSQDIGKLEYIKKLGADHTVCIGNGLNDRLMLKEAALGITVVLAEGTAVDTLTAADVLCKDILSALDLLRNPLRLTASLRS